MLNTVAVGTDGSATSGVALGAAIDLADQANARLVVISAYKPIGQSAIDHAQDDAPEDVHWTINARSAVDELLAEAAGTAKARGLEVKVVAKEGSPADVLCDSAETEHADVLVIGNKGIHRRVLANVPNRVAQHAPCTVMIVKTK
jgi:nucleotide-binding universal stress UspA family protein